MGPDITSNAIWLVVGSVATAIIALVRSGRDGQNKRFDDLLIEHGRLSNRLETMAGDLGALKAEVRILTEHRDELARQLADAIAARARLEAELVKSIGEVSRLNGSNSELLMDLEVVQARVIELEKRVAELTPVYSPPAP